MGAHARRRPPPTHTFSQVAAVVAELGADVVALPADRHDQVVAVISHVPHLAAATLMGLASDRAEEHAALLRLAAGGFRDMTRIACGPPGDLARHLRREPPGDPVGARRADRAVCRRCATSSTATTATALFDRLQHAREARTNLPSRVNQPSELAEVRIPIPDRPGAAAEVFTLAAELGVNIASFEVVHSVEGNRGVAVVLVDVGHRRSVPRRSDGPWLSSGRPTAGLSGRRIASRRCPRPSTPSSRCPDRRASPTGP